MKNILFHFLICLLTMPSMQASHCRPQEADYVIVGIGTAGAVLAKKLTDDETTSVIALHNGKNLTNKPLIKYSRNVPFTVAAALLGSPLPFDPSTLNTLASIQKKIERFFGILPQPAAPLYETGGSTPQPNADNRSLLWAVGLPEGGASSINAGAWCRGTNQLFAQWEAIAGPNWSVSRIIDIYKELENYHGQTNNPAARGFSGPIDVRQVADPNAVSTKFTNAAIQATGYPFVLDYNDPNTPIGISSQLQLTQRRKHGKYRVSSATAFLDKSVMTKKGKGVDGRKLLVHFESTALRTLWSGNTAVGVEYIQNGIVQQVYAKKGVIVCAGLKSSPFLLQSGIGPRSLLESLNIPVIFDNPNVGQGLADQPHVLLAFATNPDDKPSLDVNNTVFAQISWLPAPGGDPTSRQIRIATVSIFPGFALALLDLCQPASRGSVTISSFNPLDPPVIDFGELTNPQDLTLFQAGLSIYIKAINAALQNIDPLYKLIFPDPAILDNPTLLAAYIREEIGANQHWQSHCRMAPLAQGGVVDSTGHVYGVQNLIVADNSIVPLCMDGSPMATAYLIAANIAHLLGY